MEIESTTLNAPDSDPSDVPKSESSTFAAVSTISEQPSGPSSDVTVQASISAPISEDHVSVKRDFPVFTTATTSVQQPEALSAKVHFHSAEGDGDDARSTSSSHPFSSPNPSEQDDAHGGADTSMMPTESRKMYRRRKHETCTSMGSSSIMPGNRPPFPLSERQQMALAMQLSAQNQSGDHPKSPSASASSTPSGMGGRSRGKLAKVHRKNERGETPLHLAAKRGEFQRCLELIDDGADVNCVDYADWTPLHEACNQGWYKTAKVLVEHGANVNVCGLDDDTPLHDAALNGSRKLVILLMQYGADPHKCNKHGKRPIDVAEDPEVIRLMLEGPQKCTSPFSNYSVDSPANEENDRARTPQTSEKTLTADELGADTSTANTSAFTVSEALDTSAFNEEPVKAPDTTSPIITDAAADTTLSTAEAGKDDVMTESVAPSSPPPPVPAATSAPDSSSHTAYASTESENEQRLVVVEDEPSTAERTLPVVAEIPPPVEKNTPTLQHVSHSEPALSTISSAKPTEESIAVRPKRHIAYMRQRRGEPEAGTSTIHKPSTIGRSSTATAGVRGRKRKTLGAGPRSKDVYEFHSSESDDEAEAMGAGNKLRRKFAKVGTGLKQATNTAAPSTLPSPASSGLADVAAQKEKAAEAETRAMVEKIKMEVERKEEEREKNALAAVVDAVSGLSSETATKLEVAPAAPAAQQETEAVLNVDSKDSKDDIQLIEAAKQEAKESQDEVRARSFSQTMPNVEGVVCSDKAAEPTPILAPVPAAPTGGTGSRKERLLGFGRRRGGWGQTGDRKNLREREIHIENVVASIGSGVTPSTTAGPAQDPATTSALLNDATHGMKKKLLLELSKSDAQQDASSTASEHQKLKGRTGSLETAVANEDDDSTATGSLKVPPLKLVLAGRSNSEEDNSYNSVSNRDTSGRTYVVRSRANSPSSERRGSTAADFADSTLSSSATMSRADEARRIGAVNNQANTSSLAGNGGNGGGEASQRVTRSQVRLHGAQLDRAAEGPLGMAIHPRKRKLRSAKALIEPVAVTRPLVPVVSPSLAAIAVKNSYEAHQHMKKAIANKWKQEVESRTRPVSTDAVNGFDQFLMTKKTYLLGKDAGGDRSTDDFTQQASLHAELLELKRKQAAERTDMERRHRMEREMLIMSCESEAIRDHNRCVRGTADPAMSVMRILRDSDLYNPLQLDKDVPFSLAASAVQDSPMAVTDVASRFTKSKRQLVGRQRLEAQCLYAMQVQEWDAKFKRLLLQPSDKASSATVNVSQPSVVEDFSLLPSIL